MALRRIRSVEAVFRPRDHHFLVSTLAGTIIFLCLPLHHCFGDFMPAKALAGIEN
jgi:hypothetical protein